jgi:hypothetical protein
LLDSTLSELLEIAKIPNISKTKRDEAIVLMKELRRKGFTNREIEILAVGRWKESTIKKYTRGMKVTSTTERDKVLETFRDFIAAGKTSQDVEGYLKTDKMLKTYDLKLEIVVKYIDGILAQKIDQNNFFEIYTKTLRSDYSIEELSQGIDQLSELEREGLSLEVIKQLNRDNLRYGGLKNLLVTIKQFKTLEDINEAKKIAEQDLVNKENERKKLDIEIIQIKSQVLAMISYYNIAKVLVTEHSFDVPSLNILMEVAEKYGTPTVILGAINTHKSLENIIKEIEVKKSELELLKKELDDKEAKIEGLNLFIEKANRAVGEIEASYKKSIALQSIVDIIYEIGEVEFDPERFKQISLLFLTGINRYAKKHYANLTDWDKKVSYSLGRTVETLTTII